MANYKPSIYVASPFTKGDQWLNVKIQHDAFNTLWQLGFIPFIPLLSAYQHMHHSMSWHEWVAYDFYWVAKCDTILRLPGESTGADKETKLAGHLNKPIFYNYGQAEEWLINEWPEVKHNYSWHPVHFEP